MIGEGGVMGGGRNDEGGVMGGGRNDGMGDGGVVGEGKE